MNRIVKKYDHRFTPPMWGLKLGRGISRKVRFHKSCNYILPYPDQEDWSKLFGVAYLSGVHQHSYRFGWRYKGGFIQIAAYVYQGGARHVFPIGEVMVERDYDFEIRQNNNLVEFIVNGNIGTQIIGKLPLIGWKCGPYFGGNYPAPHKMQIIIK